MRDSKSPAGLFAAGLSAVGLLLVCLGVSGCPAASDAAPRFAPCVPGTTVACGCADGTIASQSCEPSGSSYGPCACAAVPSGPMPGPGGGMAGMAGSTAGSGSAAPLMPAGAPAPEMTAGSGGSGVPVAGSGAAGMGAPDAMGGAGAAGDTSAGDEDDGAGLPATAHCEDVSDWDPIWAQFEEEVLLLTNEARALGATCGNQGKFQAAEPLAVNAELRCAARLHSQDMGERGYFDHDTPEGVSPFDRMNEAGYVGRLMGENIAKGQQSPAEVVDGWMNSPGHCSNIMNGRFTEIGIGYWQGESDNQWFNGNRLWTQNLGAPGGGGNAGGGQCPFGPPWC